MSTPHIPAETIVKDGDLMLKAKISSNHSYSGYGRERQSYTLFKVSKEAIERLSPSWKDLAERIARDPSQSDVR